LPFSLDAVLQDVDVLRRHMIRHRPDVFRREEWAYLLHVLSREMLLAGFVHSFGERVEGSAPRDATLLVRPRGAVAIWLPGNVSLLGPICVMLLALTGNRLLVKGSSQSDDLAGVFLEYLRDALPDGALRAHLRDFVSYQVFNRDDPRSAEWAATSDYRIVFGGDAAAHAVEHLPHPLESGAAYFVDRRSEAWLRKGAITDAVVADIVRVFSVYGQAGCTSPSKLVMLDGTFADALALRQRLIALWPTVAPTLPAVHLASSSLLAWQRCVANGIDAVRVANNAAVLAVVEPGTPVAISNTLLPVTAMPLEQALAQLPENIQTIGLASSADDSSDWLSIAARTTVRRVVPISQMHHFGHVWDGRRYWADAFSYVEMGA
jgi:hypothetical protein